MSDEEEAGVSELVSDEDEVPPLVTDDEDDDYLSYYNNNSNGSLLDGKSNKNSKSNDPFLSLAKFIPNWLLPPRDYTPEQTQESEYFIYRFNLYISDL